MIQLHHFDKFKLLRSCLGFKNKNINSHYRFKHIKSIAIKQEDGQVGQWANAYKCEVGTNNGKIIKHDLKKNNTLGVIIKDLIGHFLPKDHEVSVGPNYLNYAQWSAYGSLFGTVSSVLSTQALLFAVFPGSGTIPLAAAINWIMKDGLGQLGGVLFTSVVNQRFDAEPKRWRLFSTIICEIAILLEVLCPLIPGYFLLVASTANIGKNVGWLAASASRAAIHRSFMRTENIADITGKAGSQVIATSVIGTACGIAVSNVVGTSTALVLPTVCIFSACHVACIYFAMQTVTLNTLNLQRLWLAVSKISNHVHESKNPVVHDPETVHCMERILYTNEFSTSRSHGAALPVLGHHSHQPRLRVSPKLHNVFSNAQSLQEAIRYHREMKLNHIVHISDQSVVNLFFFHQASSYDVLLGYLHAFHLCQNIPCDGTVTTNPMMHFPRQQFNEIIDQLQRLGWDTENVLLEPYRARIRVDVTGALTEDGKSNKR